ncbi:MAG TPA: hypothetical protein DDW50_03735 [Firmicutes bacterium]|nr:hypothetical protein [Bacillota bacterium]
MGNFKEKVARFMAGRYGIDQLYYALIGIYFVLIVANALFHSAVINILMWAVLVWVIFRTFSRNVYKRRLENEKFMKIWNPMKAKVFLTIRRIKEIRTHRFRKCPHCKVILRLPHRTGKHTVECPCCHHDFKVRILW